MRELVVDVESTGLDTEVDRICEIAAVEIVDLKPTGKTFHAYYDPLFRMHPEAEEVHGLSSAFLSGFKPLREGVDGFLSFIGSDRLVIHNGAGFDIKIINAELRRIGREPLTNPLADTLEMSRRFKPGGRHSLNVMARHFGVSLEKRKKHGALVDCEILASVYMHLRGGPQAAFVLESQHPNVDGGKFVEQATQDVPRAPVLPPRGLTFDEEIAHLEFVSEMPNAIWGRYLDLG